MKLPSTVQPQKSMVKDGWKNVNSLRMVPMHRSPTYRSNFGRNVSTCCFTVAMCSP